MPSTTQDLLELLRLEQVSPDQLQGPTPDTSMQRLFGGQVLAQALVAAGLCTDRDRLPHSLYGSFLRAGDPSTPLRLVVTRTRDGRAFSTRNVVAWQQDRAIFQLTASFHVPETGLEHQAAMPATTPPDLLPPLRETVARRSDGVAQDEWDALDLRFDEPTPDDNRGLRSWLRTAGPMPADPLLHAAVLAYATDLTMVSAALLEHGRRPGDHGQRSASLDHAMWFHRPIHVDQWLLHDQDSPAAFGGRALSRGRIFEGSTGHLVATTAQEIFVRVGADAVDGPHQVRRKTVA